MKVESDTLYGGNEGKDSQAALSLIKKKLKQFYSTQDTIPKLINISDDNFTSQKMDDYYVKLQNEVQDDKNESNKRPIEIQQLFESFANQPAPKRVLIKGGAGMGKSTFLSYFAYRWGKQQICVDKFNFAFKVPLKALGKKSVLESNESTFKILVELIASEFRKFQDVAPISASEIEMIFKQDEKIILLLDGYDEISNLYGDEDRASNVTNIIDYVLQAKSKFHILMTSRPNAIGKVQKKFQRKIQNKGFDLEEAKNYIDKFFSQKPSNGELLKKILDSNMALVNVIKTPINLFMLCFVVSENKEAIDKFEGEFPISQLYDQTLVWMTKRYKHKWQNADMNQIQHLSIEDSLKKTELIALKNLAYQKFDQGQFDVTSEEVKEQFKENQEIQLPKVYKFGLLRTKGDGNTTIKENDLNDRVFDFIHLSFQEHLTASVLKEKLKSHPADTAKFIAIHRNQPRYLMVLKILSGLINTEKNPSKKGLQQRNKLKQIFWEAIVCNVDGILELGAETKIKLMMHLLGQCRIQVLRSLKITNIEKIQDLINTEVLSNVEQWQESIISSGYLSPEMTKHLVEMIKSINDGGNQHKNQQNEKMKAINSEQNLQKFKIVSRIIPNFMHKKLFDNKQTLRLLTNLENLDNDLQKKVVVLQNIYSLKCYIKMQDKNEFLKFSNQILQALDDDRTRELSSKIFYEFCLSQEYGFKTQDKKVKSKILESLIDIAFDQFHKRIKNEDIKFDSSIGLRFLIKLLRFLHAQQKRQGKQKSAFTKQKEEFCQKVFRQMLKDQDQSKFELFSKNIKDIVELVPDLQHEVFEQIKIKIPLQKNHGISSSRLCSTALKNLLAGAPRKMVEQAMIFLQKLTQNEKTKETAMECLRKIININTAVSLEYFNFEKYFTLMGHHNYHVRQISDLLKQQPKTIPKMMNAFSNYFRSSNNDKFRTALYSLHQLVANLPSLAQDALVAIHAFLQKQEYSDVHLLIRQVASIAQISPSIGVESNILVEKIVQKLSCKEKADQYISSIISLIDPEDAFKIYNPLLTDKNPKSRMFVANLYGKITEKSPSMAQKVFTQLQNLNRDQDLWVRQQLTKTMSTKHFLDGIKVETINPGNFFSFQPIPENFCPFPSWNF